MVKLIDTCEMPSDEIPIYHPKQIDSTLVDLPLWNTFYLPNTPWIYIHNSE